MTPREVGIGQTVTAIYENGVLRPLEPLQLPEHARVELDVRPVDSGADRQAYRARVHQTLVQAGLLVGAPAVESPAVPIPAAERAQRAAHLGRSGVPALSAAVLEERDGR